MPEQNEKQDLLRSSIETSESSGEIDHSILRALKNRNKQLQERLQQETNATCQLEEEITNITSSYHSLMQQDM